MKCLQIYPATFQQKPEDQTEQEVTAIQLNTIYTGDCLEVLKTLPVCSGSGSGGLTLTVFWRTGHYTEDFCIDCP